MTVPGLRSVRYLRPFQMDVLDTLRRLGLCTVLQVAEDTGRGDQSVYHCLRRLWHMGLVEREGHRSLGHGGGTTPHHYAISDAGRHELALRESVGRLPGVEIDWKAYRVTGETPLPQPWAGGFASKRQRELLVLLAEQSRTVVQLAEAVKRKQPNVCERLKYLRGHGLVVCERLKNPRRYVWSLTDFGRQVVDNPPKRRRPPPLRLAPERPRGDRGHFQGR